MIPTALVMAAAMTGSVLAFQSGFDMAVAKKWEDAKVIRYHVVGVHEARTNVVFGDYEGKADVTDRITVEFVWDKKTSKIVGDVKVTDGKSEVKNIKSDGTNCPPPTLKGEYEHFQYVSQSIASDGQIQLNGVRSYPAASVSQYPASCSMRPVLAGKENKMLHLGPADPAGMAMPMPPGSPISVAADKKSFSMKGAEQWVWIFTPSVVR
jgi:hypothetical protein